jgi:aminoglycoside/choline kinase family phosphotransferase
MTSGDAALQERIGDYLATSGLGTRLRSIETLTGDASDRRYIRLRLVDDESIVVALHAGPIDIETLPFVQVAKLLDRIPLPIPAILGHSSREGLLALEDLGDATLQAYLASCSAPEKRARYQEAIGLIDRLQRRGAELAREDHLPYRIAFDVEKLTWELDFFVRHFLEALRDARLTPETRGQLSEEWRWITAELAGEPRVLCHRDFHSRNLMVHRGRLYVIDFQDARMGPDTYDLASLLRDSYVEIADEERDELVAHFLDVTGHPDEGAFQSRFDLMSVQRNLKALGTFGYQATAKRNASYLLHVPRTLRYLKSTLERHARFAGLHELLARYVGELR